MFYDPRAVWAYRDLFYSGLKVTLLVSASALAIALVVGALLACARSFGGPWARRAAEAYTETVRSTPLLIQLYLLYFGLGALPMLGRLSALQAGILALGLNAAAYFGEIIRGGIESVGVGQREAGRSLGLGFWRTLRLVVLPQALTPIRSVLVGQTAVLLKDSSIVSFVGVPEVTNAGVNLMSDRLLPNEGFLTVAAIYLVLYMGLACLAWSAQPRRAPRAVADGLRW